MSVDVDVDVVVDVDIDFAGHSLVNGASPRGLGHARGRSGPGRVPSVRRAHDHGHVHDHVATCPPEGFTGSRAPFLDNRSRTR
ncbi:MAG: hypothetical protein MUF10_15215 [Thermoanaerobaculaceae bacterium]|nr:hypothetical protein [Thermoanaerobaculaceae bacterium]